MKLSGVEPPRPMTHDLLVAVIQGLDAKLERLIIDKMVNNTFHAKLEFKTKDGRIKSIDARPSDGVAFGRAHQRADFCRRRRDQESGHYKNRVNG